MNHYNKPPIEEYLAHYGVKGMKWGVRRTPEQLGHLSNSRRRVNASNKSVDSIISSMSKKDLEKMNLYDSKYNSTNLVYRQLKKIGNTPVSFFDIDNNDGYMNVTVGTRSGDEFRGKGYANECVKKGVDWWEKNKHKYGNKKLSWWVLRDNAGSIRLAKNNGFEMNKKDSAKYPDWYHYER